MAAHKAPAGWILYDGRCPICRRAARKMSCTVQRRGFRLEPMQRHWVQEKLGARLAALPDELLLLLPDERLLHGVDAFLYLGRRIWWAWPAAVFVSLPGMTWLARRLYTWIARNRYALSGSCNAEGCRL
jgi:predicted DCC family thiol-disulfide oxidoreductase YuxK